MTSAGTLLVGIEDLATAGVVAVEAAHIAEETDTTTIVLLHVLDPHSVVSGIMAMSGYATSLGEAAEEGQLVLSLAEQAVRAEFAAVGRPVPVIRRVVAEGPVGAAIERAAQDNSAERIVLGARRPHALGRLTHPDVYAHVGTHTAVHIDIVPLQARSDPSLSVDK